MRGLHIIFISSLVALALWLLIRSLLPDAAGDEAGAPAPATSYLLQVFRDDRPFYRMRLQKNSYLMGAGHDCDIVLKGSDMPQYVGEILLRHGQCILRNRNTVPVIVGNEQLDEGERILADGCEVVLGNYRLIIDKHSDEGVIIGK